MHDARRVGAFFSGFFLYGSAISCASALSIFHLPNDIAARIGGRSGIEVILSEALIMALLLFVVALAWSYATLKPRRKTRHSMTSWYLSGIGLAWLGWLIYGVFDFALYPHRLQSMSSFLLSSDAPPLWGLLNILALLAGAWLAALLVGKRPARSRYSSNERALPAGSGTSGSRTGSLPA